MTALISARDRSIWIGVNGRMPLGQIKDGKLTLFGEREGFTGVYTLSLLEDRDGTIWAGTIQGLFRRRGDGWHKFSQQDGLGEGSVTAIYEDRQRRIWVATLTGVFRKDPGHDRFEQVDVITLSSNVWQGFSEDAAGTVWISDSNEGSRIPGSADRAKGRPHRGWGIELLHDHRGNFWVGTQSQGLWRIRDRAGKARESLDMITVDDGIVSNAVYSLLEDREGNVWVGTLAGLQRLTPHRVTPIRDLPIPRVLEVTPDGSVWAGTASGLVRFTSTGRKLYTEADGTWLCGAGSIADQRGDLWVSAERGVSRFSEGRFSPLLVAPRSKRSASSA